MNLNNIGNYVLIEVSILYCKTLWECKYAKKPQVDVWRCWNLNVGPEQKNKQHTWQLLFAAPLFKVG